MLIGDSQQDRGFDESLGLDVLAVMAARAVQVFPMLAAATRRSAHGPRCA